MALTAAIALFSCGRTDGPEKEELAFALSPESLSFSAAGGTASVSVQSPFRPEISGGSDWLAVNYMGVDAQLYTYELNVSENTAPEPRSTVITVRHGKDSGSVTVTQEAGEGPGPGPLPPEGFGHTASQLAALMYPAWNLGNTMEAGSSGHVFTNLGGLGAETAWQPARTTQAVIDFVKAQGFRAVRIPCAWVMGHISDAAGLTIDAAWLDRVAEIVDYCIRDGLYVLLNDHWDGGWMESCFNDLSAGFVAAQSAKMKTLWTQIAMRFRDYDEHLLFAGLNEPGMQNGDATAAGVKALLAYEQAFIDAVRSTGGGNSWRTLVVQGPNTNIDQTRQYFDISLLKDNTPERMMAELHFYSPWNFCGMDKDESWGKMFYYWGSGNHKAGSVHNATWGEEDYVKAQFDIVREQFTSKGIPVLIGEYGASCRFAGDELHDASIKAWYKCVTLNAINAGCVPFAWDTNYTAGFPNSTIIDRRALKLHNPFILSGISEAVAEGRWPE